MNAGTSLANKNILQIIYLIRNFNNLVLESKRKQIKLTSIILLILITVSLNPTYMYKVIQLSHIISTKIMRPPPFILYSVLNRMYVFSVYNTSQLRLVTVQRLNGHT